MDRIQKIFANEKVSASAGSGKTFSLTTRFVALACAAVGRGENPFSIIALTFTKKAAGEFLTNILKRLAKAAESESGARELARNIEDAVPEYGKSGAGLSREIFEKTLEVCAENLDRLRLGTIDALFSSIIRQNAGELKIFAPVRVLDDKSFEARKAAAEALANMVDSRSDNDAALRDFAETVKKSRFGRDEKFFSQALSKSMAKAHKMYLLSRDVSLWGNARLSGVRFESVPFAKSKYESLLAAVEADLANQKGADKIVEFFAQSNEETLMPVKSTALKRVLEVVRTGNAAGGGVVEIPFGRGKIEVRCMREIAEMADMLFTAHFGRLCEASRAVGELAAAYEREYEISARSKGKITFADMPFVLTDPARAADKEMIEYRLDAKFRHWLFDEFQDTSEIQWRALRNLVEEAITDVDKSFYYVGDIKQSIYSWRGATSALFNGVSDYYNKNGVLIRPAKPLTTSFRSGTNVIAAVNAIFGCEAELARAFDARAARVFSGDFSPHVSAQDDPRFALEMPPSFARLDFYQSSVSDEDDVAEVCEAVLRILREVQPLKRKISCAVLLYKNEHIRRVVEFLKQNGFNAAGEMEVDVVQGRPMASLFTAILRRLAHPENSASDAFAEMSGAEDFVCGFSEDFARRTVAKIYAGGFAAFAREYALFMLEKSGKERVAELDWIVEACVELDREGVASIDDAVEFISEQTVKTSANESVVQVMTVHKSKGLAFAMTIVPVKNKIRPRDEIGVMGGAVMLPAAAALAELNEDLYERNFGRKSAENFEAICKYYVSMTRAERALYVVAPKSKTWLPETDKAEPIAFGQLLLCAFMPEFARIADRKAAKALMEEFDLRGASVSIGDERWFETEVAAEAETDAPRPRKLARFEKSGAFEFAAPSRDFAEVGGADFEGESAGGIERSCFAERGIKIHAFLAELDGVGAELLRGVNARFAGDDDAVRGLKKLLSGRDMARFFELKNGDFAANEFPFELCENGVLVSGVIDRIIVRRENGAAAEIEIVDYKPSAANAEKYAGQLAAYKRAAARLFGVGEESVRCFVAGYLDGAVAEVSG